MPGTVAIIAGRGALPSHLARCLLAQGRRVVVAQMAGHPVDVSAELERIPFRIEKLGALFRALRAHDVREVVFAGAATRPRLEPAQFDFKTVTLAPRLWAALRAGDDGLLGTVLDIFEREGFSVLAAHDIARDLVPPAGVPTRATPSDADRRDAARAAVIVAALAAADVGQGAVVAQGVALAVEAVPGTDRMLAHVADVAGAFRPDPIGPRGVLFKGPKTGQDRRVDLPAIGPATFEGAVRAGLAGVVIEAGGVMLLDAPRALEVADAAGLFLWVRPAEPAP